MIKLIVGLRNPGASYEATRHNVGAWFVFSWLKQLNLSLRMEKKFEGELAVLTHESVQRYFLLPTTYMNENGSSVQAIARFYRILPHEILAVHDDLDLSVGTIRLKTAGGHGGHNGIRHLISCLGGPEFHRLRIGIGHPGEKAKVHDFVLSKPSVADKISIESAILDALQYQTLLLDGSLSTVMNQLNRGS